MMDNATRALFAFTLRRMARSVKVFLFGFLIILPWAIAITLRLLIANGVKVPMGGVSLYAILVVTYVLAFLVPLTTLFFGTSLIADEVEGGTLSYLFTRPVRREKVFLVKYAAMVVVLTAGVWLAVAGSYLLALWGAPGHIIVQEAGTLLGDLATTGFAVVSYGALFAFFGIAFKKPTYWGFLVGFGWENMVAWLPGFLKRFTLLFHLHTLMPHATGAEGVVQNMFASSESRPAAVAFLLFYTLLLLGLGCFLIRRREAPDSESTGD